MTIEEHRDEARYLARSLAQDPDYRMGYDHEAISLIALAVETKDPDLLDAVSRATAPWIEGEDEKGSRNYLLQALTDHFHNQD